MKKLIVIMMLCALQAACAGQQQVPAENTVLLSYQDLATEITVGLEAWDVDQDTSPGSESLHGTL